MKISIVLAGLVLIAGVAFAMNEVAGVKTYSFRYKLTVEIETPEGVKSGSAVREVNARYEPRPLRPPKNYYPKIKTIGEAVVVNLGDRGVVFAKMSSDAYMQVTQTIDGSDIYLRTPESAEFYSSLEIGTKAEMLPKHYPSLYMFKDLSDPLSVELINGGRFNVEAQDYLMEDNFEALLGAGVSLKSMSIEITDEPVTRTIEGLLPWLPKVGGGYLDGASGNYKNELPNILHGGHFQIGESK